MLLPSSLSLQPVQFPPSHKLPFHPHPGNGKLFWPSPETSMSGRKSDLWLFSHLLGPVATPPSPLSLEGAEKFLSGTLNGRSLKVDGLGSSGSRGFLLCPCASPPHLALPFSYPLLETKDLKGRCPTKMIGQGQMDKDFYFLLHENIFKITTSYWWEWPSETNQQTTSVREDVEKKEP